MSNKPISDLRRRMIADMTVRSFSDKTQHDYIRHIEAFARFLGRSPDTATGDDIRRFQFTSSRAGRTAAEDEYAGVGVALLPHYHTGPRRPCPPACAHALSAQAATGAHGRSGRPAARGCARTRPQAQGRAQHRLRRRSARCRGGHAAPRRYRFQAHADPCRDGQGPQGSACPAVATAAGAAASVVAAVPVAGLAVPRARPIAAHDDAATQSRLPHGGRNRRARQAGSRRIRCGTRSPRICWRATSTCA